MTSLFTGDAMVLVNEQLTERVATIQVTALACIYVSSHSACGFRSGECYLLRLVESSPVFGRVTRKLRYEGRKAC